MLVSDCCGARALGNGDCDSEDIGICPDCLEHCSYIDDEEDEEAVESSFEPKTTNNIVNVIRYIYE